MKTTINTCNFDKAMQKLERAYASYAVGIRAQCTCATDSISSCGFCSQIKITERILQEIFPLAKSKRELELAELLRSAVAIAERKGENTSWERFIETAQKLSINGVTARTYRKLEGEL